MWIDFYAHAVHPDGETDMGAQVPTPDFLSDVMQAVKDAGGIILSLDDAVSLFMENFHWLDNSLLTR